MDFKSKRLSFIEVEETDLDFIHKLQSMPEVDEFNTLGIPKNINQTKIHIEGIIKDRDSYTRKNYCWLIKRLETNDSIGICGMGLSANRFRIGEIYYNLIPEFWGEGFATEAARAILQIGFNEFDLHRIEAGVSTQNVRSIKVLGKIGMTCEGLRRKILPIRGAWFDNYHYAIIESDNY